MIIYKKQMQAAAKVMSTDATRPALNGCSIYPDGAVYSSDGHKCIRIKPEPLEPGEISEPLPKKSFVGGKAVRFLSSAMGSKCEMQADDDGTHVELLVNDGSYTIESSLAAHDTIPDFEGLVQKELDAPKSARVFINPSSLLKLCSAIVSAGYYGHGFLGVYVEIKRDGKGLVIRGNIKGQDDAVVGILAPMSNPEGAK